MKKTDRTCKTCQWFIEPEHGQIRGTCHHNPPVPGNEGGRLFPIVYDTDWCRMHSLPIEKWQKIPNGWSDPFAKVEKVKGGDHE